MNLWRFLSSEHYRFMCLARRGFYNCMSDEQFLKRCYAVMMHCELNLENPRRYTEKLQWLKLFNRKPEYTAMVDKYEVREYVKQTIGEDYLIPLVGGPWKRFEEIDFDKLPERFALKCTHDSGGLVICKDKGTLDHCAARKKIKQCLRQNFYCRNREWVYKNVEPRIIAEKYMEDATTRELRDYKFFCFDGEPKALFVATDRQVAGEEVKFDFFDMNYNHLAIRNGHENAQVVPEKPQQFELMKELARKLSQDIPHVRVDFYEVDGKVYFGEMTFFHFSGMVPFQPEEWDYLMGSWIKLPPKSV